MSGVDIKLVRSADLTDAEWEQARPHGWERWSRNWMGLRDSPYRSIQHMIRLKYIAYGSRHDQENPFQWDKVVYNLPGSEKYDPTRPWVMKIRTDGNLASEVYIYVDDGRATGHSAEACWAAIRRFASIALSWAFKMRLGREQNHPLLPGRGLELWCIQTTVKWWELSLLRSGERPRA